MQKNIRLKELKLRHFKGLEKFDLLGLNGAHTSIYGDNRTGKTTLFDAFSWLIRGKDSLNSALFEIKPLDENGEPTRGLDNEVEAVLDMGDGKTLTLKKANVEKWTKKRGQAKAEYTGNTVKHFVNGVPVKKKEYDDTVAGICDEQLFILLTNPRHFNEVLHWLERRKMLLDVCGDVSEADVIAANPDLAQLPDIIGDHTISDYRKIIHARRKAINEELDRIPVRIDEATGTKVEDLRPAEEITKEIETMQKELRKQGEAHAAIVNGGEIPEVKKALAESEANLMAYDNTITAGQREAKDQHAEKLRQLDQGVKDAQYALQDKEREREALSRRKTAEQMLAEETDKELNALRATWVKEDGRTFISNETGLCPTCGQALPKEKLAEAIQKAQAAFNTEKADNLKRIDDKGRSLSAVKTGLLEKIAQLETKIAGADQQLAELRRVHQAAIETADAAKAKPGPIDQTLGEDPKRQALVAERDQLAERLEQLQQGATSGAQQVYEKIKALEASIEAVQKEKMALETNDRLDRRVEDLKSQERSLAAEYETLELHLFLIEQFIRTKVSMLEERINSNFSLVSFQLFTNNINGGLEECCTTTVNGVPYGSLNNAARINAGLDICNTLSRHHGITLPCFVDNAEAVTALYDTVAQQIRLVVSAADQQLRIA